MIDIIQLNKQQLEGFTTSEAFKTFDFAPISELREKSHIRNPRAQDNDTLLFLAYEDGQLAGYLGMLPDDITNKAGDLLHFGWLTTLFVSEKHRGKQIAQKLLYAAEEAYKGNLMITEFTESAGRLYYKIGLFQDFGAKKAVRYYFKSNLAELLPGKKKIFNDNKDLLKIIDKSLNIFIPYFSKGKNHMYKISQEWTQELENFITNQEKNSISRSAQDFKWIINYPWLSTEKEQANYLFSSFSQDYKMFWVNIYRNEKIVAAILCSTRNAHLKVLYYFGEQSDISASLLPTIIREYKSKMLTIYDDQLNYVIKKHNYLKPLYSKSLLRKYLIHKSFKEKLGQDFVFDFKDGDGDFCFT